MRRKYIYIRTTNNTNQHKFTSTKTLRIITVKSSNNSANTVKFPYLFFGCLCSHSCLELNLHKMVGFGDGIGAPFGKLHDGVEKAFACSCKLTSDKVKKKRETLHKMNMTSKQKKREESEVWDPKTTKGACTLLFLGAPLENK
ncbi:hypothetical protein PRUPE_1G527500 [Prunus persica]|uniref:Uncharacterized protein n=1 Tax=Prunus persica TaxID=3760 RepID=A0A251RH39_PRUPE|nr:hypothetical protein PRUPE_1G527500 [Prunus persica]